MKTALNIFYGSRVGKRKKLETTIENTPQFSEETLDKEKAIEMVYDEVCEVYVPKKKAYQVVEEDKTHYFCSWECRQKYIDGL